MVQDSRVGCTLEKDGGCPAQSFPGNMPSAWWSSQAETQGMGHRDLFSHRDSTPLAVIVSSQPWKSRQFCQQLLSGSGWGSGCRKEQWVVLAFGLDGFCCVADS